MVRGEGVLVLSGTKQALLGGRLYELVAPQLDGRSADEICDSVSQQASCAEVYFTLAQLEKKGYVAEADDTLSIDDSAWWSLQQIDPGTAATRLAENRVSVRAVGLDAAPLCDLLGDMGVRIDEEGELSVVVADHYLRREREEINDAALAAGRPWLLVKPLGGQLWLGPVFRPGSTGCWKCLAERLRANRPVESYLAGRQSLAEPLVVERAQPKAFAPAAWGLAPNPLATRIVRRHL